MSVRLLLFEFGHVGRMTSGKIESVVKRPSKITGNRRNLAEECKARKA